jgi:hypothetical protein
MPRRLRVRRRGFAPRLGLRCFTKDVLRRPTFTTSLLIFLALVIAVGAATGHLYTALGFAGFFVFISAIDPKPAWRFWFDPPGDQDSGRAGGRFVTWRRVGPISPKDRFRNLDDF